MTIKISQLGNVATITGNVILPLVSNATGTLTTVKGNVDQLKTYILGTIESDVANLVANAGSQDDSLSSIESNIATLQGDVLTLQTDVTNITDGTSTFGNLVPSANVTYSLGTPTEQWKDLYLSGSTIYLGGAEISVAGGSIQSTLPIAADITANTLSVADTQITFSQGSYIDETEIVGNPGFYGLALNSPEDGIVGMNAIDANASVTSSMIVSNVSAQINVANVIYGDPPLVWGFYQDGSISFPDATSQYTAFTSDHEAAILNTEANVLVLQGNVATIEGNILSIEGNVSSLEGNVTSLTGTVNGHETRIVELESNGANLVANVANLQSDTSFTMSNIQHWTSNVTTINDALNQLAERIWNIENP